VNQFFKSQNEPNPSVIDILCTNPSLLFIPIPDPRSSSDHLTPPPPRFSLSIFKDDVQGVDDAGNVAQNCQCDVDQQVGPTSLLNQHPNGWEDDGKDDFQNVGTCKGHFGFEGWL